MPRSAAIKQTDPLRAYIHTLRAGQGFTQNEVADGAGVARRTYIAWENGETKDIKLSVVRDVVRFLGGDFAHLSNVDEMSAEDARAMAENWLKLSPSEREAARSAAKKMERFVQLRDDDPRQLDDLLRELRNDARVDEEVISLVRGYLAGLRVRSRSE